MSDSSSDSGEVHGRRNWRSPPPDNSITIVTHGTQLQLSPTESFLRSPFAQQRPPSPASPSDDERSDRAISPPLSDRSDFEHRQITISGIITELGEPWTTMIPPDSDEEKDLLGKVHGVFESGPPPQTGGGISRSQLDTIAYMMEPSEGQEGWRLTVILSAETRGECILIFREAPGTMERTSLPATRETRYQLKGREDDATKFDVIDDRNIPILSGPRSPARTPARLQDDFNRMDL